MTLDPLYLTVIRLLRLYTLRTPVSLGRARVGTLVHWCADRLQRTESIVVRSTDRRRFEIDPHDTQYRMGLLGEGRYEPAEGRVAAALVSRGQVVVDVGANFGWYTTLLSRLVGDQGEVHAFEPVPSTCVVLRRNCERNQCRNVRINPLALAARQSSRVVHLPENGASGDATMFPDPGRTSRAISCPTISLDAYFREQRVTRCDFVKCDVEGAEMEFLLGAEEVIRTHRPTLMVEVNPTCLRKAGTSAAQLLDVLSNALGYRLYRIASKTAPSPLSAADAGTIEGYLTVLASPSVVSPVWRSAGSP